MSESVRFWLDNKMSAGIKMATIGDQLLVAYREKFYVVEREAAQTRGGKALRYSKTSLPPVWKKVLNGEDPPPAATLKPSEEALPVATATKKVRVVKEEPPPQPLASRAIQTPASTRQPAPQQPPSEAKPPRSAKKMEIKPAPQTTVSASCPYCHQKHELSLDKGKNGKPFFVPCAKCKTDFAVRLVPVTMYQAQVAGFR